MAAVAASAAGVEQLRQTPLTAKRTAAQADMGDVLIGERNRNRVQEKQERSKRTLLTAAGITIVLAIAGFCVLVAAE